jgi:hypothetical protein
MSAGASVGSVLSPAASPAFLECDCEYGLGELDGERVAGRDRDAALVDPVQEGATYGVEGLRGDQRLDWKLVSSAIGSGRRSSGSSMAKTPRVAGWRPPVGVTTRLYVFFGRGVLLAGALGWDEATIAGWRGHEVVRPQVKKAAQVALMLELCEETRPYLHGDREVGEWVTTALPNLRGATPAQWLIARGHRGLRELTYGLVDWMPRLPAGEIEPVDEDAAAQMLAAHADTPGTAEFLRMLGDGG